MGGPALHVAYLSAGLKPRGYETTLVAGSVSPGEQSMSYVADEYGVEVTLIPHLHREISPVRDLLATFRLAKMIREQRPQILHTHTAKAGAIGRLAAVLAGKARPPVVVHTFHGHVLRGESIPVFGDGKQSRDFTFIDDAVEANVRAWKKSTDQAVYNVGGGSQVEVLEAIAILEKALGVKAKVRFEPRPPGDPLRTRADATRLQRDLEFVPRVSIEQGLHAEAEWARRLYAESRA